VQVTGNPVSREVVPLGLDGRSWGTDCRAAQGIGNGHRSFPPFQESADLSLVPVVSIRNPDYFLPVKSVGKWQF
jgi:hypothetical protein